MRRWVPSRLIRTSALTGLLALTACTGDTPASDISPADLDLITVFYPVDGLVRGRGLPGTFPVDVTHVVVRAQPTGTSTLRPVDEEGGFTFAVVGISGDLLEIAGARDDLGTELGQPVYVRVPPTPLPTVDYVCCQPRGTCQSISDNEAEVACPDPLTGVTTCETDLDCGIDEGEYLEINLDRVTLTKPNERGRITVTGFVEANALVVVENRGLNGIGLEGPRFRSAQITSDIGAFVVDDLRARGDDEIVIQVRDLNGFRSPATAKHVPDADMVGLDVIGAFAWEPLTNGVRGPIALHLAPWGVDGRGICPDTAAAPEVCFSGGLSHEMVNVSRAQMRVGATLVDLNPARTATSATRPHVRGREGDVRGAAQDIVVVLDTSATAEAKDGGGISPARRFEAAARFVEGLRARDRVALVSYAGTATRHFVRDPNRESGLRDADGRAEVVGAIRDLASQAGGAGNDVFLAIEAAAANLRNARSDRGRIVVIAAAAPEGNGPEALLDYDRALGAVSENLSQGDPQLTVDFVGLQIAPDTPNLDLVQDVSAFTEGRYYESSAFGIEQTLTDVRSFLSGSFILLYDVDIPVQIGKSGTIELDVEVLLGEKRATASYQGPVLIQNSSNN